MSKLKDKRFFLCKEVNSFIRLEVPNKERYADDYEITMHDCNRQIHWCFKPNKKGLAKMKKVVDLFNSVYEELKESVNENA